MPLANINKIPSQPIIDGDLAAVSDAIRDRYGADPLRIEPIGEILPGAYVKVSGLVAFVGAPRQHSGGRIDAELLHYYRRGRIVGASSRTTVLEVVLDN